MAKSREFRYYLFIIIDVYRVMDSHSMDPNQAQILFEEGQGSFHCKGSWSVQKIDNLFENFMKIVLPKGQKILIDGKFIHAFDSAGALVLMHCLEELKRRKNKVELLHFSENQMQLIHLLESKKICLSYQIPLSQKENLLYQIGKESENKWMQLAGLVQLIGDLSIKLWEAMGNWRLFQFPSLISNVQSAGINALPILALLSFLIGVVLAYQMGLQLETYGANSFIAYLSGMAIFREFAPLITAIIVAGRTSSAYTAQIGAMKINEEIDVLLTMGLSPTELLVMPKMLGLLLVFPLLIFWADIFGILGAMIMSKFMLYISFEDFLQRLKDTVGFPQMRLGLYKAPAFALLIALVGCYQGFRVQSSADNIGSQTTRSVVQALFLIIVADSVYTVVYSWMKW